MLTGSSVVVGAVNIRSFFQKGFNSLDVIFASGSAQANDQIIVLLWDSAYFIIKKRFQPDLRSKFIQKVSKYLCHARIERPRSICCWLHLAKGCFRIFDDQSVSQRRGWSNCNSKLSVAYLSVALISTFCSSMRYLTVSKWPSAAAKCKGVRRS